MLNFLIVEKIIYILTLDLMRKKFIYTLERGIRVQKCNYQRLESFINSENTKP